MSTDTTDSPWRRLPWTLPAALLTGFITLWAAAYFIDKPADRLPEPPGVEAQLVEIPAPVSKAAEKKTAAPVKTVQPRVEKTPTPVSEARPTPDAATSVPAAPAREQTKEPPAAESTGTGVTGSSGARAILKPMPQIPDELRQDALSATAIARFHVAIDGTATVELIKPTPNPKLNRLLLDTLKNWRFFPSMKDGKPVASTQELSIKVEVK